ncbi:hypothetical protein GCM10020370_65490 [Paenibacillus hodogayensis]
MKLADPSQIVRYMPSFPLQLRFVIQMLQLAAAALSEYRTRGFDPLRTRLQHLKQPREAVLFFDAGHLRFHLFARQRSMNKKGKAVGAAHPFSLMSDSVDLNLHPFLHRDRCRDGGGSRCRGWTAATVALVRLPVPLRSFLRSAPLRSTAWAVSFCHD